MSHLRPKAKAKGKSKAKAKSKTGNPPAIYDIRKSKVSLLEKQPFPAVNRVETVKITESQIIMAEASFWQYFMYIA